MYTQNKDNKISFLFVSGLSGAGKSQAVKILEDAGYFCIDNLPLNIADKFVEMCITGNALTKIAIVFDIRGQQFFHNFYEFYHNLNNLSIYHRLIFFEASDDVLVSRFKETRRRHPLGLKGTILDDISKERELLNPIKDMADIIIDTSGITVKELREKLLITIDEKHSLNDIVLNFSSFGYKYGMIKDADIIFDVRFLPNPFWVDNLKTKTGLDKEVKNYVLMWPNTKKFIKKFTDMLDFLLPQYIKEGKKQLHIAFGCTGGKHRSVTLAEYFSEKCEDEGYKVYCKHRDIEENV